MPSERRRAVVGERLLLGLAARAVRGRGSVLAAVRGEPQADADVVGHQVPGLNIRVRTNLRRDFNKKGRNKVIAEMTRDDPRPLVVFEVATYAEDPEEILVTMPIDSFAALMQRNR
jgi:hypothetical protein